MTASSPRARVVCTCAADHGDLPAVEIVLQRCGEQWWNAILAENMAGETPLALAEAAGAGEEAPPPPPTPPGAP